MLTERSELHIEIRHDGQLLIREDTVIERDGVVISRLPHRRVLEPSDTHNETNARLVSVIDAVWDSELIDTYRTKKESIAVLGNER